MLFFVCGIRLFTIATDKKLSEAAVKQSTKRLNVADLRGTIFDCNGIPLTNVQQREVTVVFPSDRGALALSELLSGEELEKAKDEIPSGKIQKTVDYYSYQTLRRIWQQRHNHRLPMWHDFCKWIESLPFADELILIGLKDGNE